MGAVLVCGLALHMLATPHESGDGGSRVDGGLLDGGLPAGASDGGGATRSSATYVQGSRVNVRERPRADAPITAKLPIGTLVALEPPVENGQWCPVRIEGAAVSGFALCSLFGAERPTLEGVLAQVPIIDPYDAKYSAWVRSEAHRDLMAKKFFLAPSLATAVEYAETLDAAFPRVARDGRKPPPQDDTLEVFKLRLREPLEAGGLPVVRRSWNQQGPVLDSDPANQGTTDTDAPLDPSLPAAKPSLFQSADDAYAFVGAPFAKRARVREARATAGDGPESLRFFISSRDDALALSEYSKLLPGARTVGALGPMRVDRREGYLEGAWDIGSATLRFEPPIPLYVLTEQGLEIGRLAASHQAVGSNSSCLDAGGSTEFFLPTPPRARILMAFLSPRAIDAAMVRVSAAPPRRDATRKSSMRQWTVDLDGDRQPDFLVRVTQAPGQVQEDQVLTKSFVLANVNGRWVVASTAKEADCT